MALGIMKLAAAALIGACAVYAISQAADRSLDRTSTENDPLRNIDNNKDDILRIFRNKKENFAESDVTYAVVTLFWVKEQVKSAFNDVAVKKVALTTLSKLVLECPDEESLLRFENANYVLVTIDYRGEVKSICFIQDTAMPDPDVIRLLGDEEMVVITR